MDPNNFLSSFPSSLDTHPELLSHPGFRDSLYRLIHPTPTPDLLPLIRTLFRHEVTYRSDDSNDGEYFENLYWAALFLFQIGTLDDVIPMWRAKGINMDTGSGLSVQFLVGRGVKQTIEFLQQSDAAMAPEIAECLIKCQSAGDFDCLDDWLTTTIRYYD